jgi:hypothetical protein
MGDIYYRYEVILNLVGIVSCIRGTIAVRSILPRPKDGYGGYSTT